MPLTDGDMNTNPNQDSAALSEEVSEPAGRLSRLPVTYSILAADALLAMIERTYELPSPLTCELLLPSMNDTYLLTGRAKASSPCSRCRGISISRSSRKAAGVGAC